MLQIMPARFSFVASFIIAIVFFVLVGGGLVSPKSYAKSLSQKNESTFNQPICSSYDAIFKPLHGSSDQHSLYYEMEIERGAEDDRNQARARAYIVIKAYQYQEDELIGQYKMPYVCFSSGACSFSLKRKESGKVNVLDYVSLNSDFSHANLLAAKAPYAVIIPSLPLIVNRKSPFEIEGIDKFSDSTLDEGFMKGLPSVWLLNECKK